ncbi:MAG TPA: TetR/AcrR family transcriptional regulator [Hyphomicrobiales bacterium]|nr:TetR/AcrR family transcriptional regulator [Hyphomicrobiales bacterium]
MLDTSSPRDRIVTAALRAAEKNGWRDLSLGEIAAEAAIPLGELRSHFQAKAQILAAFSSAVDQAVIEKFPAPTADAPRDRLFDVLLTRFEIMQPYKAAIARIRNDLARSPAEAFAQLGPALKSQYWMLAAAGISGEGGRGLMRAQGLAGVYRRAFTVWLEDDDPGMARTMAMLDRHLRRAESIWRGLERIRGGLHNIGRSLRDRGKADRERPAPDGAAPIAGGQI